MDFIDSIIEAIVSLVILGIIIGLILVTCTFESADDEKAWNNGFCSCGGHWEYQQAVGHRYDTDYIYKCDTCGKIKEFDDVR